jgi:hypothetical protein
MEIINLEAFLKLPSNTLYQKYEPQVFSDLEIKVNDPGQWEPAWLALSLWGFTEGAICSGTNSDIIYNGKFRWDLESIGRDGYYDHDQLFCVYDKEDVQRLINQLSKCL